MTNVVDPLGGSYYVEALTQELVDAAQAIIDRVAAEGGMAKAVAAGWPKALIEEAAADRQERADRGGHLLGGDKTCWLKESDLRDYQQADERHVASDQLDGNTNGT